MPKPAFKTSFLTGVFGAALHMVKSFMRQSSLYFPANSVRLRLRSRREARAWCEGGCCDPPPQVIKHATIVEYAKRYNPDVLVETGTCLGDTIAATRKQFKRVYSIELSPELHARAKRRFSGNPAVTLLLGDSSTLLKDLLPEIRGVPLFWLDAHYSGGCTARGLVDTPIVAELNTIFAMCPQSVVLIDDARCFDGTNSYPTWQELRDYVNERAPSQCVEVRHDIIRLTPNAMTTNSSKATQV